MSSITCPTGIERPALPPPLAPVDARIRHRHDERSVPFAHVAVWCAAGVIGWSGVLLGIVRIVGWVA